MEVKKRSGAKTKKMSTKQNVILWGSIGGAVVLTFVILFATGILGTGFQPTPPTPEPEFGWYISDGATGKVIPSKYTNYTAWETDDTADFASYKVLESGTDLTDLTESDVNDPEIDTYVVIRVGAEVPQTEEMFGEDGDTLGTRYYYNRWFIVSKNSNNTITLYQEFHKTSAVIVNSATFETETIAGGIDETMNVTFMVAGNATQIDAMWVTGKNYQNEVDDSCSLTINFLADVSLSDFNVEGTTKRRVNSTAIAYDFYSITAYPLIMKGTWADGVTGDFDSAQLLFGDLVLANLA